MAFEDILDYPAFSLRIAQADMEKGALPALLFGSGSAALRYHLTASTAALLS